ncbi:uncharacterized protein LOC122510069 [Leptopilina heterotoma]|uniref:uncharacterized protein LOC122510069 n=1 Tax=Leptopilina heterotoma TaxID=63436 RepID=UPI001CA9EE78|nr:uncharacterized protein LOC122510069 [Leptopilina heterotoma]
MPETIKSVITNRDRTCLGCRLVSGCGLLGSGMYVSYHSKKFQKIPVKSVMLTVGGALMALGTARVLNLPPFQDQFNK